MRRIEACFKALKAKGETALIPFVTAGDPDLETTEALVLSMADAGADIIELGVPFSDPTGEGPTIQRSSSRALEGGTNLRSILQLVSRLRARIDTPLVLMGYANPIHAMGAEAFAKSAVDVGVDGIIIPDLTPEDGAPYLDPCRKAGIDAILLAARTTRPARMALLMKETQGFLYYVSLQGDTGARQSLAADLESKVIAAQACGDKPVCVGFGIGTPEQAEQVAAYADGVVVGSAIVDRIEAAGSPEQAVDQIAQFISDLKKPLRTSLASLPLSTR